MLSDTPFLQTVRDHLANVGKKQIQRNAGRGRCILTVRRPLRNGDDLRHYLLRRLITIRSGSKQCAESGVPIGRMAQS